MSGLRGKIRTSNSLNREPLLTQVPDRGYVTAVQLSKTHSGLWAHSDAGFRHPDPPSDMMCRGRGLKEDKVRKETDDREESQATACFVVA